MIAKGLIERLENPGHRRILMTRLTDAGETLLADSEALVDTMETALFAALPSRDLETLRRGLRAIIKAG